jgi:hypothetical protein
MLLFEDMIMADKSICPLTRPPFRLIGPHALQKACMVNPGAIITAILLCSPCVTLGAATTPHRTSQTELKIDVASTPHISRYPIPWRLCYQDRPQEDDMVVCPLTHCLFPKYWPFPTFNFLWISSLLTSLPLLFASFSTAQSWVYIYCVDLGSFSLVSPCTLRESCIILTSAQDSILVPRLDTYEPIVPSPLSQLECCYTPNSVHRSLTQLLAWVRRRLHRRLTRPRAT